MKARSTLAICAACAVFLQIISQFACEASQEGNYLDKELTALITNVSPDGTLESMILPESDDFANIPNQDPKNPMNAAKVTLGKLLFHDPGIGVFSKFKAGRLTYSCSSCHIAEVAFLPGRIQGVADGAYGFGNMGDGRGKIGLYRGDDVDAQGARPLTIMNLAYVTNALWSGAFGSFGVNVGTESVWNQDTLVSINFENLEGLEAQNIRALQVHRQFMNKDIADSLGYTAMFDKAFPDFAPKDRYSLRTASFAIAAYFRSILTNRAPYQRWLKGDLNAMTEEQKKGAILFFGKAGCFRCHHGPALNSMTFHALGVKDLFQSEFEVFRTGPTDKRVFGRGGFTGLEEDMFKFKVPQLYNLKFARFYFHGGSHRSLEDVVEYFNRAEPENPMVPKSQISPYFKPLNLTEEEKKNLVAFLKDGLYDADITRFKPTGVMSGLCTPNNDVISRIDLNCN